MDEITKLLPRNAKFELRPRWSNYGFSDYYGAIQLVARYCGKNYKEYLFDFFWPHGCSPPWQNLHPVAVTFGYNKPEEKYFVAREDQRKFLLENGYKHVYAIGMPIIYVPEDNIARKARSLLIMPPHLLKSSDSTSEVFELEYIKSIEKYFSGFDLIYACVSPTCIEKGMWLETFKDYGIKTLSGASHDDSYALNRMATLFKYFDVVTTPVFGSHVPYALYFGARVSIWGSYQEPKADIKLDGTWAKIPDIAEKFFDTKWRKSQEKKYFENHYVSPAEAVGDESLGAWFLGAEYKRTPEELIDLFGWTRSKYLLITTKKYFNRVARSKFGKQLNSLLPGKQN